MSDKPRDWVRTETRKPDEGQVVWAMDSGGHVQDLVRKGGAWYFPDMSMHVYFTPLFWQSKEG